MLGILLSIIGLICIIISLIYINKISKKERDIYEEIVIIHSDVKEYSFIMEGILNNFDNLIETSLSKIEEIPKSPVNNIENEKPTKKQQLNKEENDQQFRRNLLNDDEGTEDFTNTLYREIIELKNIGLSNEEIAKKVNKGIREVEIITKMWGNI